MMRMRYRKTSVARVLPPERAWARRDARPSSEPTTRSRAASALGGMDDRSARCSSKRAMSASVAAVCFWKAPVPPSPVTSAEAAVRSRCRLWITSVAAPAASVIRVSWWASTARLVAGVRARAENATATVSGTLTRRNKRRLMFTSRRLRRGRSEGCVARGYLGSARVE